MADKKNQKRREQLQELRSMDERALKQEVADREREMMNLRFRASAGQLDNPAQIKQLRRRVARAKTIAVAARLEAASQK